MFLGVSMTRLTPFVFSSAPLPPKGCPGEGPDCHFSKEAGVFGADSGTDPGALYLYVYIGLEWRWEIGFRALISVGF